MLLKWAGGKLKKEEGIGTSCGAAGGSVCVGNYRLGERRLHQKRETASTPVANTHTLFEPCFLELGRRVRMKKSKSNWNWEWYLVMRWLGRARARDQNTSDAAGDAAGIEWTVPNANANSIGNRATTQETHGWRGKKKVGEKEGKKKKERESTRKREKSKYEESDSGAPTTNRIRRSEREEDGGG